jgi:hypothetical protein
VHAAPHHVVVHHAVPVARDAMREVVVVVPHPVEPVVAKVPQRKRKASVAIKSKVVRQYVSC